MFSPEEKSLHRTLAILQRLDRHKCMSVSGHNMFFRKFVTGGLEHHKIAARTFHDANTCMNVHALLYDELSLEEQREFEEEARRHGTYKTTMVNEERVHLLERCSIIKTRMREAERDKPIHVASHRFSQKDLERFLEMRASGMFSGRELADLRQKVGSSPKEPDAFTQGVMNTLIKEWRAPPRPALLWWTTRVCNNREQFQGVALQHNSDTTHAYLFLHAIQRPFDIHVLQLDPAPMITPTSFASATAERIFTNNFFPERFTYQPLRTKLLSELAFPDDDEMWLLEGMRWRDGFFVSACRWEPVAVRTSRFLLKM